MSRHLLLEDLSMVVLLARAEQTPGPFAEQDDDYIRYTNDLTLAGTAGSPGLSSDRETVTNGVPLTLAITVYDVSSSVGVEFPNVEVLLWHTDSAGIYSAVGDSERNGEDTDGQVWCRGIQVTGNDGTATFATIVPGWYPGRAIHYHLRLRLPGATDFAATSQLYISDTDLNLYQDVEPYSFNPAPTTRLFDDTIFVRVNNPTIQDLLTLQLEGSVDTGFSSSVSLGVVAPPGMLLPGTERPTIAPTDGPTAVPTDDPTSAPTSVPTKEPTVPVPRPSFEFEAPNPPTVTPSSEVIGDDKKDEESTMAPSVEPTEAGTDVLDELTMNDSNAATSSARQQYSNRSMSGGWMVAALTAVLCVQSRH